MNHFNYQYILAIAEHGNISKAADSLYVSQPYLNKVLIRLENELGAKNNPCFYQLGDPPLTEAWYSAFPKGAKLTPASVSFLDLVRQYVPGLLTV